MWKGIVITTLSGILCFAVGYYIISPSLIRLTKPSPQFQVQDIVETRLGFQRGQVIEVKYDDGYEYLVRPPGWQAMWYKEFELQLLILSDNDGTSLLDDESQIREFVDNCLEKQP